jgi:5-methylthioribose kinase
MNAEEPASTFVINDPEASERKAEAPVASKRDRFFEAAPSNAFFLDANDPDGLAAFLGRRGWIESGEKLASVETAGQGNMNYVLRVRTSRRTFILKQSRPWVEKYPGIAAPFDRALVEATFYGLVATTEAAEFMPKLYGFDVESRILWLEDLGTMGDCSGVYSGAPFALEERQQIYRFLSVLHAGRSGLANRAMRTLNHFHIFVFPFQSNNELDLDHFTLGLQRLAERVKASQFLLNRVSELGRIYLADGDYLLHGDCFPGSWLRTFSGIKVIDPEFAFAGPREFDLGVLAAHERIAGFSPDPSLPESHYAQWKELDLKLVRGFAGVEILRRLLGVAQLPTPLDFERKSALIENAIALVLG